MKEFASDRTLKMRLYTGGSFLAAVHWHIWVKGMARAVALPGVFFLEMGALDGVTSSNTLMFEQCLGWNGVLIEADPFNFKKLRKNRPCAVTLGEGACSVEDGPTIRMGGADGTAFDVDVRGDGTNGDSGDTNNATFHEVPCRPLGAILEENGVHRINFFSLDVEGAELKVLRTIDWDKIKIDVLMVETDMLLTVGPVKGLSDKIQAVRQLVQEKGNMRQVPSRLDFDKDPATGQEKDLRLCERNGYMDEINCMFLSIAGSDVFVSPELYEYDTKPWLFNNYSKSEQ